MTDAGKAKFGRAEALKLARGAKRVIVVRGSKVHEFDMERRGLTDEALLDLILGPTGNLRAPTLRRWRTLIVGFSEDAYRKALT